jgi:hypothetical protein
MRNLPPAYFVELFRQLAFLSVFLGGFAATFLATLLAVDSPRKAAGWAIGSAAFSAAFFIITAMASVMLVSVLHPDIPADLQAGVSIVNGRIVSALSFILGMYALLLGVGVSGWIRSRSLGLVTSLAAGLAAVVVTWILMGLD